MGGGQEEAGRLGPKRCRKRAPGSTREKALGHEDTGHSRRQVGGFKGAKSGTSLQVHTRSGQASSTEKASSKTKQK